jgi:GTP-binding protein
VFRDNQVTEERIMDSNDLERERGITILAKNTAIRYKDKKINIIDTPGHADFGGEVERVLNMVDGVLLVVDSVEGPMPQTRFVLKKALAQGLKVVVVINKIDRPQARPEYVLDKTFDLFCDLCATDEQCEFPVVYASGVNGISGDDYKTMAADMGPLFETIVREVPPPCVDRKGPLVMMVTSLDYDEHKGRIALGRVNSGSLVKGQNIRIGTPEEAARKAQVNELFVFDNFQRTTVDSVEAGDICAMSGLSDVRIGETIMAVDGGEPLPSIKVEEPTVRMTFAVNTSPFAGQEGKFVTSRNLRDRLARELERNLALRVEDGETSDMFIVSGRGALHITILIETMRREGFEFCIGPPTVIMKEGPNGEKQEPYEIVTVEVADQYSGACVDMLSQRRGQMLEMGPASTSGSTLLKFRAPTRGLIGVRNAMLTATRGTAVLNTLFDSYDSTAGDIPTRDRGSLVAHETGKVTTYALLSVQERGVLFVKPGVEAYENMIVGIHQRPGDLKVNVAKQKAATNVRSNKDATVVLDEPKDMSLDDCVEYIAEDELVEVTPINVRMLKNPRSSNKKPAHLR